MNKFNDQDYVQLLYKLYNSAYQCEDELDTLDNSNYYEPIFETVKDFQQPDINSYADLTKIPADKIKDFIYKHRNLRIGNFLIQITNYCCSPSNHNYDNLELTIIIHEEFNYNSKQDKVLSSKVNVNKDHRFECKSWRNKFNSYRIGSSLSIEDTIDIVRWLQGLNRLSSFL